MENKTISGLLISDTSDHFRVFTVYDSNYRRKTGQHKQLRQIRTEEAITTLKHELMVQDRKAIYSDADVNNAYNRHLFHYIISTVPLRQIIKYSYIRTAHG